MQSHVETSQRIQVEGALSAWLEMMQLASISKAKPGLQGLEQMNTGVFGVVLDQRVALRDEISPGSVS